MGYSMMKCPKCGACARTVKKEMDGYNTILRTRKCRMCDFVFQTREAPDRSDESFVAYLNRVANEMSRD